MMHTLQFYSLFDSETSPRDIIYILSQEAGVVAAGTTHIRVSFVGTISWSPAISQLSF